MFKQRATWSATRNCNRRKTTKYAVSLLIIPAFLPPPLIRATPESEPDSLKSRHSLTTRQPLPPQVF